MAATTTLLGLVTPTQGTLSGTWGDTVNYGISDYVDISVAGTLTLTNDGAVTLANTTGSSSGNSITSSLTGAGTVTAQFAIVRVTGTLTVAKVVTAPSYSKTYTVVNAATGGIVTFKASGQTGVSVAVGESAFVYFNGTDYVKVSGTVAVASFQTSLGGLTPSTATTGVVTLAGTLNTSSGGTGLTSFTAGDVPYYVSGSVLSKLAIGTAGQFLTSTGTAPQWSTLSGVAVTTFSAGTTGFTPSSATSGAVTLAGTLATTNGGTGLTSFTSGGVVYASSSSVLATGSALYFDGTNLGVGSTGAGNKLTLSNAGANGVEVDVTIASGTESKLMSYNRSTNVYTPLRYDSASHKFLISGGEQMRLDTYGNLGLGTSTLYPSTPHVYAPQIRVGLTGNYFSQSNAGLGITGTSFIDNAYVKSSIGDFAYITSAKASRILVRAGEFYFQRSTGTDTADAAVNFTTTAVMDSAGNLGLGVTPSAWSNYTGVLQMTGGALAGYTGGNYLELFQNGYYGGGLQKYVQTGYASKYQQNTGTHQWYVAPSGTAGDTIPFTQAMTLDASGQLALGQSGPILTSTYTGKLSVYTAGGANVVAGGGSNTTDTVMSRVVGVNQNNGNSGNTGANEFQGITSIETALVTSNSNVSGNSGGYLMFKTKADAGALTERLRIAANGAFGLSGANYGTNGQVLTSSGSAAAPTWTTVGGGSAATPTALGTVYGKQTTSGGTPYLTAYGYNAGAATTGVNNVFMGVSAGEANVAGTDSVAIGYEAMKNYSAVDGVNIAIGSYALTTATTGSCYYNVAIGYESMKLNTSGYLNTAIGFRALQSNTSGRSSVAVGYNSLRSLLSGNDGSTAVGSDSLSGVTTGIYNVGCGGSAGSSINTGSYNTLVGYNVLGGGSTSTSSSNTAIGYNAMPTAGIKNNNVAIGREALFSNQTAGNCVAVGYQAGYTVSTGFFNTLVGYQAGQNGSALNAGAYNTLIGNDSRVNDGADNYCIVISTNTATGKGSSTGFISPGGGAVYQGNNQLSWSVTSDQRLKKNIVDNNTGLEKLTQIQVRNFEYRTEDEITELPKDQAIKKSGVQLGVIAQELQAVLPECVKTESTGVMSVDADNLTWYMINAIKELKAELDAYKASHP